MIRFNRLFFKKKKKKNVIHYQVVLARGILFILHYLVRSLILNTNEINK